MSLARIKMYLKSNLTLSNLKKIHINSKIISYSVKYFIQTKKNMYRRECNRVKINSK